MVSFPEGLIENALDAKVQHLSAADVERVAQNPEAVNKMIADFPDSWEKARRQAKLLYDLIAEDAAPQDALKQAAGALIYLGAPVDLVPDDEQDGFADDAAVVGLAVQRVADHVRSYCATKGLNASDYLD